MKKVSEHLGQIIVALAAIALLVCAVVVFKTDLAGFFNNIIGKETSIADEVLANMGDFGVSDMGGSLSGSGDGQVFYQVAPETLSFRSTAPLSEFKEVKVNGTTIDRSNYDLTEGSTIVTLKVEYLGTLPEGTYTMTIVSDSGSVTITFKVVHAVIYGDVDGDGDVDADDAQMAKDIHLRKITPTSIQKIVGDVNGDGRISMTDVSLINQYTNGEISIFPVEE